MPHFEARLIVALFVTLSRIIQDFNPLTYDSTCCQLIAASYERDNKRVCDIVFKRFKNKYNSTIIAHSLGNA